MSLCHTPYVNRSCPTQSFLEAVLQGGGIPFPSDNGDHLAGQWQNTDFWLVEDCFLLRSFRWNNCTGLQHSAQKHWLSKYPWIARTPLLCLMECFPITSCHLLTHSVLYWSVNQNGKMSQQPTRMGEVNNCFLKAFNQLILVYVTVSKQSKAQHRKKSVSCTYKWRAWELQCRFCFTCPT